MSFEPAPVCSLVLTSENLDSEPTTPAATSDSVDRIRRLGRRLRTMAGALRRRGIWLVFGALGGLIGGTLIAVNTQSTVTYRRYYKATATMRLETPATTAHAEDQVRWSLQLAQLAMASDGFRDEVAAETGVSSKFLKNHVMGIAYAESASLDITAITTEAPSAEQIAYHAAIRLNDALAGDLNDRRLSTWGTYNEQIDSVDALIVALRDKLPDATGDTRRQITRDLAAARAQSRLLRQARQGTTITPPTFVLSSSPHAIRINSRAYFQRWQLATNDLGVPRIQANVSLAGVANLDSVGQARVAKILMDDTELPQERTPPPLQPITLGLLAGLVMGISGVVLGEAWDDRIHGSVHATRSTGMNVIVEIPRLSRKRLRGLTGNEPPTSDPKVSDARFRYQEAAWVIATELGLEPRPDGAVLRPRPDGSEARPAPIVLVTSTSPSEGKTTSTAALATALANLGFDVLAVDGDYHHRSLRKLLRPIPSFVDPEAPAITMTDRVWHMDDPASADRRTTSSAIVARLVKRAISQRENFDIILLDTPPVLSTTDAIEYLQYADAAVLIVRIDQTLAQACEQTANMILRHKMAIPGMIVTDVPKGAIDQFQDHDG